MSRKRINRLTRRKREITPKQHPLRPYKLQQHIELDRVTAQCRVVVEPFRVLCHLQARVLRQAGVWKRGGGAAYQEGEIAAGVGEDDFHGRGDCAEDGGVGHEDVDGRAARFVREVEDGLLFRCFGKLVMEVVMV